MRKIAIKGPETIERLYRNSPTLSIEAEKFIDGLTSFGFFEEGPFTYTEKDLEEAAAEEGISDNVLEEAKNFFFGPHYSKEKARELFVETFGNADGYPVIDKLQDEVYDLLDFDEMEDRLYVSNGRNGLDFDWETNGNISPFVVYYKTGPAALRLIILDDGKVIGWSYPKGKNEPCEIDFHGLHFDPQEVKALKESLLNREDKGYYDFEVARF